MQSINVTVINPWFFTAFLGTAILCIAALATAFVGGSPAPPWLVAGAIFYLVGSIGVTMALNVPLNNALAAANPESAEAAALWTGYLAQWTLWNHVRTAASLAAAAAFTVAASN